MTEKNTMKDIESMTDQGRDLALIERLAELADKLLTYTESIDRRLTDLQDTVYKLAPDLEIVETMYEGSEQQEYIDKYMNHGSY